MYARRAITRFAQDLARRHALACLAQRRAVRGERLRKHERRGTGASDGSCLGDHQGRASNGTAAQMHQVPIRGKPIDAAVLAHRRDGDPIAQRDAL